MIRSLTLAFALFSVTAASGCKHDDGGAKANPAVVSAPPTAGQVGSDGLRHIAIEANKEGYTPAKITGKPGEKLVLVFTRTADSSCIAQLKAPDGAMVDLPLGTSVDVAVTVPQTGEVGFACGMDMFHGVVTAQPST